MFLYNSRQMSTTPSPFWITPRVVVGYDSHRFDHQRVSVLRIIITFLSLLFIWTIFTTISLSPPSKDRFAFPFRSTFGHVLRFAGAQSAVDVQDGNVFDLYVHLSRSQSGAVTHTLSRDKAPLSDTFSPSLSPPIDVLWESVRSSVQTIRLHIATSIATVIERNGGGGGNGDGTETVLMDRWNATQIAVDTAATVRRVPCGAEGTPDACGPSATFREAEFPPASLLEAFISPDGMLEGLTPDRAFPRGSPFRVGCPSPTNPFATTSPSLSETVVSSTPSIFIGGVDCDDTKTLVISVGPKSDFRLWHLRLTAELIVPLSWINYFSADGQSMGGADPNRLKALSSQVIPVPIYFSTNIPSSIKQHSIFILCCAIGIGSIATGGGGWIGLTSLQTLIVSVGGPNHCSEPFTDYYFDGVYTILVAPTTLAQRGIETNHALTVGIILACILGHVAIAGIKMKLSRQSFWSAARWSYFPMLFLIAVTYLWIRMNSETFLGIAGSDQSPLIRVSFAFVWTIVITVTFYVWHDALTTGHDGYYLITQLPTVLEKTVWKNTYNQKKDGSEFTISGSEGLVGATSAGSLGSSSIGAEMRQRRRGSSAARRHREKGHTHPRGAAISKPQLVVPSQHVAVGDESPSKTTAIGAGAEPSHSPVSGAQPEASEGLIGAAAQQQLLKVESLVVRVAFAFFGRFAWLIIPEGSWPLTRGYGVCRGLFRDTRCSFAIFTLLFLCVIAAVSNSASCQALYLNSAIVQSIYLVFFLLLRPFRIPVLNMLWVVIKVSEIVVNGCLYSFLQHNFDGGVTDVIPALATVIVGLNAAFVFYACLVTFSERSARNSEKLKLLIAKGKGLTAGDHNEGGIGLAATSSSDITVLDRNPLEDPDFLSFAAEYRSMMKR